MVVRSLVDVKSYFDKLNKKIKKKKRKKEKEKKPCVSVLPQMAINNNKYNNHLHNVFQKCAPKIYSSSMLCLVHFCDAIFLEVENIFRRWIII